MAYIITSGHYWPLPQFPQFPAADEEYSPDEEEEDETAEEVSGCSLLVESEAGLHRKG